MYLAGALISELEEAGINVLYRIGAVDKTNGKPRPFRAGRRSVTFALIDIWAQGAIKITKNSASSRSREIMPLIYLYL